MGTLLFLFLTASIGANAAQWDAIKNTEDTVRSYYASSESVISSMEQLIKNSTAEAATFLANLDELSIVKEMNSISEGDSCRAVIPNLKELKSEFKLQFSQLEGPISKRISDLRGRFEEVLASLAVHQGLADSKYWNCRLTGKDCHEETEEWVQERMKSLACKLVTECKKRNLSKRQVGLSCGYQRYEFRGECYDMNDQYICDRGCDRSRCYDEPSPGCSRYCVGRYHCSNLQCIDKSKICDGTDDCGDNSDEEGCVPKEVVIPPSNCTLESGKYLCSDHKKCVDIWMACDGKDDCEDGSDEGGECGVSECSQDCSAAGGVCVATPKGRVCLSHCPPGTSETPQGCLPQALPVSTLAQLLDDVPRLTSRYIASFKFLQNHSVDQLAEAVSQYSRCKGSPLSSVVRLSGYLTTEYPPHTTTKHPTTHHPTTHHPTTHHTHYTTTHSTPVLEVTQRETRNPVDEEY